MFTGGEVEISSHPRGFHSNPLPPTRLAPSPLSFETKGPPTMASASLNRPRHGFVSGTASSTATSGKGTCRDVRMKRAHIREDPFSSPHRLELSLEMGHIRSSFSSRQIFLIHSLSSSMARMKGGRPLTTIRAAQAHDRILYERMTEEGQSMIAWEDHIYQEVPSLRSRYSRPSVKSLPGVVSSWWKYACFNVVIEIQQRNTLLAQCNGVSISRGRSENGNFFMRTMDSQRTWDWAKQSRIRREYIDQYFLAHEYSGGLLNTTASAVEAAVAAAKFRLEQMEDDLSVERILLLKKVARAASIRRARADDVIGQTLELSSPADMFFCFPPNTNSKEAADWSLNQHQIMDSLGNGEAEIDGRAMHPQKPLAASMAASKKLDGGGRTIQDSTVASGHIRSIVRDQTPRDSLSFSANLFLSGFSLAICDFSEGDSTKVDPEYDGEQFYQTYPSDDISILTGFSDDNDSKTPKQASGGDAFDPFCRFWSASSNGLYCQPILLMHIADIVFSAQTERKDELHLPHVESEFSVKGISIQAGCLPPQHNLFCLGHIPHGESPHKPAPNESVGISGQYSDLNSAVISVGPAEFLVDWSWLEKLLRFASVNKDVGPSRVTTPLESEDLLVRTFSNPLKKTSAYSISITLEFDKLSLTIPVYNTVVNDGKEILFLVTTANHLHVKAGNLYDSLCDESADNPQSNIYLLPSQDMLFVLDGFDTVIATQTNDPTANSSITRLLRCPVDFQLQYSSGAGICSLEQPQHHSCQSNDVRSSAINILVSELRLRTLRDIVDTFSDTFINAGDTPKARRQLLKPSMPALAEYVLAETKLSIQSLGIHIIPDEDDECAADNSLFQEQLEDTIASFISQLSCLDVKHPSQNAIACMSRLFIDRCCALGLSKKKARECAEAAKENFKREARALFYSASNHPVAKVRRRKVNRSRQINGHFAETLDMNPETLSDALDQVVGKAALVTIAELGDVLLQPDPNHSKHVLFVDVKSVVVSRSLLYSGNTVQINVKSFKIRNGKVSLLSMHSHSSDIQANHPSSEERNSSDETDEALTISLQDRGTQEIYFEAGYVESIFAPEEYLEAIKVCSISMEAILGANSGTPEDSINLPQGPTKDTIVNGIISSFTLTLTDKLLPFIECQFQDVAIEKSTIGSHATTTLQAGTIYVDCVCQSTYPNIISTYQSTDGENFNGSSAFSIQLTSHQYPTSGPQ